MDWSDWHKMNKEDIDKIPEKSGVYQLNSDSDLLYVGQSNDLRRRLGEHLDSSDTCIQRATKFAYRTTSDPEGLEKSLLNTYSGQHNGKPPPCND